MYIFPTQQIKFNLFKKAVTASKRLSKSFLIQHIDEGNFSRNDINGLEDDVNVMLAVLEQQITLLYLASDRLRENKEFMLKVLNHRHAKFIPFELIGNSLLSDKEFVHKLVSVNGEALQGASDALQNDEEIVFQAMRNKPEAYLCSGQKFREKHQFKTVYEVMAHITAMDRYNQLGEELPTKAVRKKVVKI
jgi:uncharacterized protein YeaO (DUF488 family)